jgi:hypothetical protein
MKRSEIIAALGELEDDSSNIRGWLDAIDAKIAALRERLVEPGAAERAPLPVEVEYDRSQLDAAPKPIPFCDCGERAAYKSGKSASGKEWAAYFCARKPNDPDNCNFKQWVP